jgi:4-hydroxy-tetrahydrodipicolinate synthase
MTSSTTPAEPVFRGIGVALVSLFDADGTLLTTQTAQLARQLVDDGVSAVLIGGTTGEFWTLSTAERITLTEQVRAAVPAHVPVLLNVGAATRELSMEAAAAVGDSGADAVLCLTPPGVDPAGFYPRVREAIGGLPLLAYHFPRAGFEPVPLAVLDLVDGTKDSSGESERLVQTPQMPAGVYTGSPLLLGLAGAIGVPGALLALANVDPASAQAALKGDRAAQARMVQLHRAALGEPPPRAVKRMVAERYGTPAGTRPPTLRQALDAA